MSEETKLLPMFSVYIAGDGDSATLIYEGHSREAAEIVFEAAEQEGRRPVLTRMDIAVLRDAR